MDVPGQHRTDPHEDDDLIDGLEPDQIDASAALPLPPMDVGRAMSAALWLLRIYVLIITAIVVYTFVVSLK